MRRKIFHIIFAIAMTLLYESSLQASAYHAEAFSSKTTSYAALLPGNFKRGKAFFNKTCKSCHSTALRFKAYKKTKVSKALRTQPLMARVKVTSQQLADLVVYFSKI